MNRVFAVAALGMVSMAGCSPRVAHDGPGAMEPAIVPLALPDTVPSGAREIAVHVRASWGNPSYILRVSDTGSTVSASLYRTGGNGFRLGLVGSVGTEWEARELVARLDSLDVWSLASPESDDGSCRITPAGKRACDVTFDTTDVELVMTAGSGNRRHSYNDPEHRTSDAARRVTRLATFIAELATQLDSQR